jgi:flagellar protein FliS
MYSAVPNPYQQYRTTSVQTASPVKLLLMVYDGLIVSIKKGKQEIEADKPAQAHISIVKAQDILTELMSNLNMDYPISQNLFQLYDYMKQRLVESNIKKNADMLEEVLTFAQELRDTWVQAAQKARGEETGFEGVGHE